jgi:diguanylate cyclase (GGDEF)-like protein
LRGSLRSGAHAARLGGDEFAVLLSGLDDVAVATVVAQRVLAAVNRPYSLAGQQMTPTASIGLAVLDENDADATWETLVNRSDLAMYDAKRTARGGYCVYDPSLVPRPRLDEFQRSAG